MTVDFIEQNIYGIFDNLTDADLTRRGSDSNAGYALTYLSEQAKNPTDNTYYYPDNAGDGVDIYIIDSGINTISPSPFGSRLQNGVDYSGRGFQDDLGPLGHGTSVAACAGSDRYGTSKASTIWNYKVIDNGAPSLVWVETALADIITHAAGRKSTSKGAVINLSATLGDSANLLKKIQDAVSAGITVVASAGNRNIDSTTNVPCKYSEVVCVGAINEKYEESSFSNWGKALTLYAPGENVDIIDKNGNAVKRRGTSFAAPYVAGIAAIYYGVEGSAMNPARVKTLLDQNAEKGIITGVKGGGPNALANNGKQKASNNLPYIGAPAPPPPQSTSAPPPPASTSAPTAPAPTPQYATGICSFHLNEYWDCGSNEDNLTGEIKLYDSNKTQIGDSNGKQQINAKDPCKYAQLGSEYLLTSHRWTWIQTTFLTCRDWRA